MRQVDHHKIGPSGSLADLASHPTDLDREPTGDPCLIRSPLELDPSTLRLFATYLASRWNISLSIVSVMEAGRVADSTLREAQSYAERHEVTPALISKRGDVAEAVLQTANERKCDFFVVGGYGNSPIIEAALGSAVDHILRESDRPVLICR